MSFSVGCFALIQPFTPLSRQFELIRDLGLEHADLTDNHDGAALGEEYGFSATLSLDAHPASIRQMAKEAGLTLTSVCAHANLLDPADPAAYGTTQIIKAIRMARDLGIAQVITTEGEPRTDFGRALTRDQQLFSICEKLQTPMAWARELRVELLIEPHGMLTDTVDGMSRVLDALGHPETGGINLDTGNCWLGGGDPLEFVQVFGRRIRHVHWKDLGEEWMARRGTLHGCGMGNIPLGEGVVGIEAVVKALLDIGFDGPTTLEIAGEYAVKQSIKNLKIWSAH